MRRVAACRRCAGSPGCTTRTWSATRGPLTRPTWCSASSRRSTSARTCSARPTASQPRFYTGPGFIEREQLLIGLDTLESAAPLRSPGHRHRPRLVSKSSRYSPASTWRASCRLGVGHRDDERCPGRPGPGGESLLKPHPYLLAAGRRCPGPRRPLLAAYVGDYPGRYRLPCSMPRGPDARPLVGHRA